ncbi:MAG: citrate/2-methylcitrate synthase [Acidimicrobiales bacterium]|nr:citrate/2-methylcitrate synthase [Acidimicrobiales bacterium]
MEARAVSDVMSSPVLTATADETLAAVSDRMWEQMVGSVIVVDGDAPVGILTERDLIRFGANGGAATETIVGDWMTAEPDTVGPDAGVAEAYDLLADKGFRHFPVVEDGTLVGVVSLRDLLSVAAIQPVMDPGQIEAPPGLEGVIVAETTVGDVRGQEGFYHYRQYSAVELADKVTLEDAWYLLFEGELPTAAQRSAFMDETRPLRSIPAPVYEVLPVIARESNSIMEGLRTAVSLVAAASDMQPSLDVDHATRRTDALRLCSVVPTLIMAMYRLRRGLDPIEPRDDLGYGANYLWMMDGSERPDDIGRAVEQYQMTTIDHGFNASTFTSRVICSTGADVGAAVVGGIGALSGPLHGGAPSRALDLLDAIGTTENARPYLVKAVENGEKIMGFGHRVYKTEDPRSAFLRDVAERIGAKDIDFAKTVEQTVVDVLAELKPGRDLYANVEFYAGVVMDHCGLPRELFTPTFASSRVIGWCANILEQAADNRIIRPSARYVGPPPPQPLP